MNPARIGSRSVIPDGICLPPILFPLKLRYRMSERLNWNSRRLTASDNAAISAFLHGLGWQHEDFHRPLIAVGAPELDLNLCNLGSDQAARQVVESCRQAGLLAYKCGLPAVSDNLTQGIEGGRYSLPSRESIADNFAAMASAHCFDGMIGIHFCDKNFPGLALAMVRNNFPSLIFSGGSIRPGRHQGRPTTILSAYDAQAAAQQGEITAEEADAIIRTSCPGKGGCGLMATFNTMAMAGEAMGLIPPNSAAVPAEDPGKADDLARGGQLLRRLLEQNLRPRDILTKAALENGMRTVAAIGGSTNAVLHLLALAQETKLDFGLRDIQRIVRDTPVLANFAPRGPFNMIDLYRLGGTPVLFRHLIDANLLAGDYLTVTGDTLAANYAAAPPLPPEQELLAPIDQPFKPHADMQVCFGNLAPDGIVFKVSGSWSSKMSGPAVCFDSGQEVVEAANEQRIEPGQIVVLRYQGPIGSPGMPELLLVSSALSTTRLKGKVALICDGRVSGVAHGTLGVHCSPEAAIGGPLAAVQDGDPISFDLLAGAVQLHVDDRTLDARLRQWRPCPLPTELDPFLKRYAASVSQASHGCYLRA